MYGFIPQMQVNGTSATTGADLALLSSQNIETFFCQVNIRAVLRDMWTYHMYDSKKSTLCNVMPGCRVEVSAIDTDRWRMDLCTSTTSTNKIKRKAPDKFISKDNVVPGDIDSAAKRRKIQSREEILATAQLSGAKGG